MQIKIAASVVAQAAFTAVDHANKELTKWKEEHYGKAVDELVGRAKENGYAVTDSVRQQMEDMARRDVDSALERHPAQNTIEGMQMIVAMCGYALSRGVLDVTIDHTDFHHLKEFLPKE